MNNNNPWLALSTYEEQDEYRFRGREVATKQVLNLIRQNDSVVCYAMSGSGKSSLINAGVCPQLRREGYFPIKIIFSSNEYKGIGVPRIDKEKIDFDKLIGDKIQQSLSQYKSELFQRNIYQKNINVFFEKKTMLKDCQINSDLWSRLRTEYIKVTSNGEFEYLPILIFDQFEEIFQAVWKADFFQWLETFMKDVCPYDNCVDIPLRKRFKVLFSLRYEYIGDLDYWCTQRFFIPQLQKNRYYLNLLNPQEAISILSIQPSTDTAVCKIKNEAEEIVSYIANEEMGEISPIIISLLGYIIYNEYTISSEMSFKDIDINDLIYVYYQNVLEKCKVSKVEQEILESVLISSQNTRLRVSVSDTRLNTINIKSLVNNANENNLVSNHLLRKIEINNETYIEFTHDKLVDAICEKNSLNDTQNESTDITYRYKYYTILSLITLLLILFFSSYGVLGKYKMTNNTQDENIMVMDLGNHIPDKLSQSLLDSICRCTSININRNLYSKSPHIYCYDNVLWGYNRPIFAEEAISLTFGDERFNNIGILVSHSVREITLFRPNVFKEISTCDGSKTVFYIPYGSKEKFNRLTLDNNPVQEMGIIETIYEIIKYVMCTYYVPMFFSHIYVPLWINCLVIFICVSLFFSYYHYKQQHSFRTLFKLLTVLFIVWTTSYIILSELYWLGFIKKIDIFFLLIIMVACCFCLLYTKKYKNGYDYCLLYCSDKGKGGAIKIRNLMIDSGILKSKISIVKAIVKSGKNNLEESMNSKHIIAIICDEDTKPYCNNKQYWSVLKCASLLHPIIFELADKKLPKNLKFIYKGNMKSFPAIEYRELLKSENCKDMFLNSLTQQSTPYCDKWWVKGCSGVVFFFILFLLFLLYSYKQ
nr:hypothetical protein [Prevotella sp.]